MFKKIATALLVCGLLVSLAACKKDNVQNGGNTTNTSNGSGTEQTGDATYLSDLSTDRYDGYNYRILIRKNNLSDQYLEEDSSDLVESATFKRNKTVEDMYGITITATESSDSNYEADALNTILAGDDAYDAIFTHSRAAFSYAVQGTTVNFNEVSTIHLDKPWWYQDITDSCNINGNLYVLAGDISSQNLGASMCLFFDKRIFDELGLDYPYQMVKDGTWTFDEFAKLVKQGAKDLNGDGVLTPDADQYGFVANHWQAPMNILYTGGQKIYDKDENGELQLTLYSDKTVRIYDKFFDLMNQDGCYMHNETSERYNFFPEGRAMFVDGAIDFAKQYRAMDDDFGIIPYPKFDESDTYATATNGGSHLLIMPITVSDTERTGAITEALCAIGSRDVIPAYYEVSLKTKYSRDTDSEEMLDIIKNSIVYDLGYVAGGAFQSCGHDLANSETPNFSSYYAAKESMARNDLKNFVSSYGKQQ